jgi:hypothetical protein
MYVLCTVAAVEISGRKDLNTLYKFRNLISVNRIFIKDYKVSVSIWHIRSKSRVTFEMPQLSDLQKCVWLREGVSIRAIAREINVDNVWVTFWETSLSIPFTKLKVWRCQSVWVFNGRNCTYSWEKSRNIFEEWENNHWRNWKKKHKYCRWYYCEVYNIDILNFFNKQLSKRCHVGMNQTVIQLVHSRVVYDGWSRRTVWVGSMYWILFLNGTTGVTSGCWWLHTDSRIIDK